MTRQTAASPSEKTSAVAVCADVQQAKDAIKRLHQIHFPTNQISLVARSLEDDSELHAYVNHGDRAEKEAGIGALVGGLFGTLAGAAFFWVPGFGPLLVLGPLAGGMTGVIVGALVGAMMGWGIPEDQVAEYEAMVKEGKYLVIAHGEVEEVDGAYGALQKGDCEEVYLHAETSADSPEIDDSPR